MKPDDLWEKYGDSIINGGGFGRQESFLAALKEYGDLVKAEAVKVCHTVESVKWNMALSGKPTTLKCADAIEKMELPGFEKQVDPNKWAFDRGLESF